MKSTIRVEMDFDTMQPVLRINHDKESDDLRDQTLKYFIEKASSSSATLQLSWRDPSTVDIRCAQMEDDPLVLIDRCKNVATRLCKTDEERDNIYNFFNALDAKASVEWLNRDPDTYKAKYSV